MYSDQICTVHKCWMSFFSLLLFLSWNRKSNGMTDYRFSSVDVLTFLPCVLGGLLAVAHSRSDIEMSKPLSQITTAENVFSGCLTMQHSPLRTQSFRERLPKSACSQAPLSSSTFSETHMIISDQICMHQTLHYLAGPWTWLTCCQDVGKENVAILDLYLTSGENNACGVQGI